jgi:hypothetical protein
MSLINPMCGASMKSYRAGFSSMSFLPRSRPHPFSHNCPLLLPTESIVSSYTSSRIISSVPHAYRLFSFLGCVLASYVPHRPRPFFYLSSLPFIYPSHLSHFISSSNTLRLLPPDTRHPQTWGSSTTTALNIHCNRLPNTITTSAGLR